MATLELTGMVASLVADWLTIRKDDAESKDTAAFQRWLREEAFPKMEAQAERTLLSTVRLRIEQRDQFDQLVTHVLAIKHLLGATTAADIWHQLSGDERALLNAAYDDVALPDTDRYAYSKALRATLGYETFRSAARSLVERGYLHEREASSGMYDVVIKPAGAVLVLEVREPDSFAKHRLDVARALPTGRSMKSLKTIADEAVVSLTTCALIMEAWQATGDLTIQSMYPVERSRVTDVKESLRRRYTPD